MPAPAQKELFGGAIVADLPPRVIDVSNLRQVPDNQEVFVYAENSVSFVIEILEAVAAPDDHGAARFHFDSLAHDNDAEGCTVLDIQDVINDRGDDTPSPIVLQGTQQIRKYNRPVLDQVEIMLSLFRVKRKDIDIVVTVNIPVLAADGGAISRERVAGIKTDFDKLVRSLQIIDYSLFA
ncbi:hypothetical protein SERLA73DRAFT_185471 [Serpula lacrymans var. lacrymans S7.3]|uniref:Mog1p/PsbP-like protein n=2 Tax=Serpula lacrymans var. lacrymans TaxID=341189 RepID=F8Q5V7_SERL3|nr:uncharacterized protein SERLADRAFT_473971 [Serpula lacrymans var. lacrymans S7.9]EGN95995.1 hypothetical protein SERLA73DRAFT_185471 [Serpula lacrymans var. lacrymans S7.3]EGO21519.1 hypothetical protein SERLADRAFT_473971 [Serpula lacrymans var. lacrymans S7.9]